MQTVPNPTTPLPPVPPQAGLSGNTIEGIMIAMVIVAITVAAVLVLKPLFQAFARRIEGKAAHPALRTEIDFLHERIADLEPLQRRVTELEERLEFTERLLAQRRDQEVIGPGGEH